MAILLERCRTATKLLWSLLPNIRLCCVPLFTPTRLPHLDRGVHLRLVL